MDKENSPTESLASTVYFLDDFKLWDKIAIIPDQSKTRVVGWQTGVVVEITEEHYKVKFVKGVDVYYDENNIKKFEHKMEEEQWVSRDNTEIIDTFDRKKEEIGNIWNQKQIVQKIYKTK